MTLRDQNLVLFVNFFAGIIAIVPVGLTRQAFGIRHFRSQSSKLMQGFG